MPDTRTEAELAHRIKEEIESAHAYVGTRPKAVLVSHHLKRMIEAEAQRMGFFYSGDKVLGVPVIATGIVGETEFQVVNEWNMDGAWSEPTIDPGDGVGAVRQARDRSSMRRGLVIMWRRPVCFVKGHDLHRTPSLRVDFARVGGRAVPSPPSHAIACQRCGLEFARQRREHEGGSDDAE